MSIRIYALAKQLKVDSKSLVDTCNSIGIVGKGSALASLSDEEVSQIKAHMSGGGQKKAAPVATAPETPTEPVRASQATPAGRPPAMGDQAPSEPEVAAEAPAPPTRSILDVTPTDAVVTEAAPVEEVDQPEVIAPPATPPSTGTPPTGPPQVTPTAPPAPTSSVRREDYIGPGGAAIRKMPVMDSPATKRPGASDTPASRGKSGPSIKLAPMPTAQQPVHAKKKTGGPAPQKPDIKLPADAIKASKLGSKPLSEHLRKHEKKAKAATKKTASAIPGATQPETQGRDRGRRTGQGAGAGAGASAAAGAGGREQRQLKRKRTTGGRRRRGGQDDRGYRQVRRLRRTGNVSTAAPRKTNVVLELPCTVKSFAESTGLPVSKVLGELLRLGTMSSINASLDVELAELLAEGLEVQIDFREAVTLEDELITSLEEAEDAPESLQPRPPIVTFLGHVDHGKTSLLDKIIDIDVVSGEKGGITQHIRAYRVEKESGAVAFVDTPGHEAFTAMRARGANCTDIAVLVVAADDGIMPQTEEAISHAKAAGVPIVVALNKTDLPGVNIDRVLQELATNELLPSEWGGDTEVVRTSAMTGDGIEELMDTLLTVAELHEYKANPDRPATGVCLESEVQPGRGVLCKVLIQKGTMKVGDVVVCGPAHGRVKAMYDTLSPRKKHQTAGPSTPVTVTGLDIAPGAGDRFHVLDDISKARQIAESRAGDSRETALSGDIRPHVTLENLFERLGEMDDIQTLNIILRADVRGSIEAIRKELTKLSHPEVQIKILQATVGGVTEADVHLADASDAVIIAFNVVPDEGARMLADQRGVQIRRYDIIYRVTEDLKASLEGMLRPEERESVLGRALVQRTFSISRLGTIAGCRVLSGVIQRNSKVRVIRDSRVIGDYPLESLRREKDDAREAREGLECGMKLSGYNDLKEGDILEAYKIEKVGRSFEDTE